MIQILHDLIHANPRNYGSIVYIRSCRIYILSLKDPSWSAYPKAPKAFRGLGD